MTDRRILRLCRHLGQHFSVVFHKWTKNFVNGRKIFLKPEMCQKWPEIPENEKSRESSFSSLPKKTTYDTKSVWFRVVENDQSYLQS